ncbi:TraA family conjugative transfer protein [Endozoicomonas lisbonensis]
MLQTAAILILALLSPELWAADTLTVTGSNDFSEIYGRLVGWIKGDLGRTLSISFVLIGLAYGMARNSLIGFATGVGAAVGLQVTPTIINSIFGL